MTKSKYDNKMAMMQKKKENKIVITRNKNDTILQASIDAHKNKAKLNKKRIR